MAWVALAALGAFHGVNPAMGWLFAVSLGFQQGDRRAVLRALAPIALGHALAVGLVVLLYAGVEPFVSPRALALGSAVLLVGFGTFRLLRPLAHFRWVGMRVGRAQLTLWSFLMATGHGAGLMLLPALGAAGAVTAAQTNPHLAMAGPALAALGPAVLAVALHTVAMLAVIAVVSTIVFDRLGLAFLRRSWLNVDLLWAAALIVAGTLTVLLQVVASNP